jgi:predicted ArsR family transcriptional regulator
MPTFKQRILENIARERAVTVPELSKLLGISKPAVQYHIRNLLQAGEIEPANAGEAPTLQGRPMKHYRVSQTRRPDNLEHLADVLLRQLFPGNGDTPQISEKLKQIAALLAGDAPHSDQPLIRRIEHCMARLTEFNYNPHWEVARDGSLIHLRNCPYACLLASHPELCQLDHHLIETLLGVPVQISHLRRDRPDAEKVCEFVFKR